MFRAAAVVVVAALATLHAPAAEPCCPDPVTGFSGGDGTGTRVDFHDALSDWIGGATVSIVDGNVVPPPPETCP